MYTCQILLKFINSEMLFYKAFLCELQLNKQNILVLVHVQKHVCPLKFLGRSVYKQSSICPLPPGIFSIHMVASSHLKIVGWILYTL